MLDFSPWWLRTESFFGDEAREVVAEEFGGYQTPLRPGTAGGNAGARAWWASSTCAGEPAVHTLSFGLRYDDIVRDRISTLFKAYADDITERRGCTDVKFPRPSDFRSY
ncbi:hypothetical protein [Streptomyces sp. NBC_00996]|uniref:hypothetical protein n=1 Tax=Streptomyces sp. NBC_00996 TaxID=2903710 RepID=UPI00386E7017|nr:hypothetical protein OG390_00355 [Streptomyces sp. NBC_00996]